ncbi:MAG: cation transporter [Bacteroidia bacterium]|nr:cation transporter [Bacteroidia bacterium]
MKNIKALLIFCLICFISSKAVAQKDTLIVKSSVNCATCKKTIESGLRFEKGVQKATVDYHKKTVTIIYRSDKTDAGQLRLAISNLGYNADTIAAKPDAYNKLPACCKAGGHD